MPKHQAHHSYARGTHDDEPARTGDRPRSCLLSGSGSRSSTPPGEVAGQRAGAGGKEHGYSGNGKWERGTRGNESGKEWQDAIVKNFRLYPKSQRVPLIHYK